MNPSDILFVVNPKSGNKRKKKVLAYLSEHHFKSVQTEYAGHAEVLAREAVERVVVAVGGDGTVNEVARGIVGSDKVLGIVPCGSGDGLALSLGLSRNYKRAIKTILDGCVCNIDSAIIDHRPFFSVCGVGFDAVVSSEFASSPKRGLAKYIQIGLRTLMTYKPERYVVEVDGMPIELNAVLITIGNSNQWGNNAKITPLASLSDGKLEVTVVENLNLFQIPYLAFLLMTGNIHKHKSVRTLRGENIRILRESEGVAHFDGDWFMASKNVDVAIRKGGLKVISPNMSIEA